MEAGLRLYQNYLSRPIHKERWKSLNINLELSRRAELSRKTVEELTDLSILASIFSLPSATYKIEKEDWWEEGREKKVGGLSLAELRENPKILKRIMAKLTTNDLAGPRRRKGHISFEEERKYSDEDSKKEESQGELEMAATILSKENSEEWFFDEINKLNASLFLEAKLKSANLTPRERAIIEARLADAEPTGTPGSIKTTISRLRKKIQKK